MARYCALEEERKKWEAREEVLSNNLARVSRELEAVKATSREAAGSAEVTEQLAAVESQLHGKCEELSSWKGLVHEVEEERDSLKAEIEDQLVALQKRFTPVQLTAVQTQLFHERHQGPRESVDEFAQELRKLFSKAYSRSTRGGPEAEALGQSMLSNQFIVGLRPELKTKMVGMEGSFEELLMKSRFEEVAR